MLINLNETQQEYLALLCLHVNKMSNVDVAEIVGDRKIDLPHFARVVTAVGEKLQYDLEFTKATIEVRVDDKPATYEPTPGSEKDDRPINT